MRIHLPLPEAPDWTKIDAITEPFYRDEEIKIFFEHLKRNVRREWKEGSRGWSDPLIALYNAHYGRLWRELRKLKKCKGNIRKAKKRLFQI